MGESKITFSRKEIRMIIGISALIFLLSRIRLVTYDNDNSRLLVIGVAPELSWILHPKTFKTPYGNVHIKAFTLVASSDSGSVRRIENNRRHTKISHNLTIMGNKITVDIDTIILQGDLIDTFFSESTPQPFQLGNNRLEIVAYIGCVRYEDGFSYLRIADFSEFRLIDSTIIKPVSVNPWFLKFNDDQWTLTSMFIVTSPAWEGEKYIDSITVEKDWGNIIEYTEVKDEEDL
ncbi:MAG: hypothetical protein LBC60_07615 [Spirochaetaceae bacterium]|jgi:hypothetical protein|nr:hypothetical protein [Spirochaetaceae bacterium]